MILTVCLNPTIQKTFLFDALTSGDVNRAFYAQTDASGKGVNVSRVLTELGMPCRHLTALGGASEPWFCDALSRAHIGFTAVPGGAEIRTCCTLIEATRLEAPLPDPSHSVGAVQKPPLKANEKPFVCTEPRAVYREPSPVCPDETSSQKDAVPTVIPNVPPFTVKRVTELIEEGARVLPECEASFKMAFSNILSNGVFSPLTNEPCRVKTLVISGSKARGFGDELFPTLVCEALTKNITVIADFRGTDLRNTLKLVSRMRTESPKSLCGTLIIKPNFDEFCATFCKDDVLLKNPEWSSFAATKKMRPKSVFTKKTLLRALKAIYKETGALSVITNGSKPLTAFDGKTVYRVPCAPLPSGKRVQNTIGCGDAFTAGFAASFTRGESFEAALHEGNRCGALNAVSLTPGSVT